MSRSLCDVNRTGNALSETETAILEADLAFVRERLVFDGRMSESDAQLAEREFRRFMMLVARDQESIAAFSPMIDEFWHQFILFTSQYRGFCERAFGFFVDHTPASVQEPIPASAARAFIAGYRRHFGPLPEHLFSGLPEAAAKYLRSGATYDPPPLRWSGWLSRQP